MKKHVHIPINHGHVTWSGKNPPTQEQMDALNELAEFAYQNAEKLINKKNDTQLHQNIQRKQWSNH